MSILLPLKRLILLFDSMKIPITKNTKRLNTTIMIISTKLGLFLTKFHSVLLPLEEIWQTLRNTKDS